MSNIALHLPPVQYQPHLRIGLHVEVTLAPAPPCLQITERQESPYSAKFAQAASSGERGLGTMKPAVEVAQWADLSW